jgi:hypothetical protein
MTDPYASDESQILREIRDLLAELLDEIKNGPGRRAAGLMEIEREVEAQVWKELGPEFDRQRQEQMESKLKRFREMEQ